MALTDKENIVDINLEGVTRQRFRINGDPNCIIELNLSDMSIDERLKDGLEKLEAEMSNISQLGDDEDLSDRLKEADAKMREYVDYIFDYPVSEVCAKNGTMYDPINGMFRYEVIIDGLTKLYTDKLNEEYKKLRTRVQKYTDKYTTKKPTKSTKRK